MKIAVVHYHLQRWSYPGDENTLQAWNENGNEIEVVALSGRTYLGKILPNTKTIEGLDYTSPQTKIAPRYLWTECKHLQWKHLGKNQISGTFITHSLGKNPSLTEAVALLAQSGERILLHPHDFAEDGRPGNYLSLSEVYQRAYQLA